MAGKPQRPRDTVRRLIVDAVGKLATRIVEDENDATAIIPIAANEVLREVNATLATEHPDQTPLTTGYIQARYGGRDELVAQSMAEYLGPDTTNASKIVNRARKRLKRGEDPTSVRHQLASLDYLDMAQKNTGLSRLWFAYHSRSRRPDVQRAIDDVYTVFDDLYLPLYRDELEARGRHIKPGFELIDLAIAQTALTEGLALRTLGNARALGKKARNFGEYKTTPGLMATVSEGILLALTEPVATE